jgi:GxxExxY protein
MHRMDRINEEPGELLHGELTSRVLEAAFEVANELGARFLESVYERALILALREKGLSVASQVPLTVRFRGEPVGQFYADLVVEDRVIVELKAAKALLPEHLAQVINYLKATGIEVGLLLNFGNPKLEYRRLHR